MTAKIVCLGLLVTLVWLPIGCGSSDSSSGSVGSANGKLDQAKEQTDAEARAKARRMKTTP
jgi:hypothetical protein